MIERIVLSVVIFAGFILAIARPDLINANGMREVVSYDGLALIALIFTITTAAAVTVNLRVLEVLRKLPDSPEILSSSKDLRRTMRRNTLAFFYGFFIAAGCFFVLTIAQPEPSRLSAVLIVTFFSVLIIGFYLALDVYRVTFGLIETEARLDGKD